ncbi:GNAT family N-acetyltransferase [Rathayibacter tanaceti]|uniref:Acetyltransferase (GNAT) family protein n=2 Tax=Rathayibacter tanaceti TaxID=1671680 RepID=A0A166HW86_9MICO|nr:GNAT family N-acetyltransferase [Rathayibacter tanaceti]KZX21254.1 Acetyltransferase (GNAT) family protein [Rathayibacter tanaceti]QHC54435.1 GNAT family N-acetyltransferase [Rathayibacter tanaceti]TCO35082.1 N-acetylglutamate synthase-like GNAT family acetyltransferase [Rathayibacter tanaceti]
MTIERADPADTDDLRRFLREADLTLAGLDSPAVRLWIERDGEGRIVGSTGWEASDDGRHALIRSVAVASGGRGTGAGSRLACHSLADAASSGAGRAWLFSRRSGPFWQSLGFAPADRDELASALPGTHQVRLFRETGQLAREVAWTLRLRPAQEGGRPGRSREPSPADPPVDTSRRHSVRADPPTANH